MKKEFNHIVLELAHKNNIEMDEKELLLEANKWELLMVEHQEEQLNNLSIIF